MSLRRGHIISKQFAPPKHVDEWQDQAQCRGMMSDQIPVEVCEGCPVTHECLALFAELDTYLHDEGSQYKQRMPGTWGGIDHGPGPTDVLGRPRTNTGRCVVDGCEKKQATMKMCSAHYQRSRRCTT